MLWTQDEFITMIGAMNFFVLWKNLEGDVELVTPPLDGTVLPGVYRDSVLQITREIKEFKVSEKPVSVQDLVVALKEKRVKEVFGTGTANGIMALGSLHAHGDDFAIPFNEATQRGELAAEIGNQLRDICTGKISPHEWVVSIDS